MSLRYVYSTWLSPQRWLERLGVRAPMRVVVGQVVLAACVLLFANALRLIPNDEETMLHRRRVLSEIASVQVASAVTNLQVASIRELLSAMVRRNSDLLSAGLKRADGTILFATEDHKKLWAKPQSDLSPGTHVRVQLFERHKPWGELELRFSPLPKPATAGEWWAARSTRMIAFVLAGFFFLNWLYLSRMLKVLDPARAVPSRLQVLMDTLVEGAVLLDDQDCIVLANQSFADTAFETIEQLIGRDLGSLPWLLDNSENSLDDLPWKAVRQTGLQQKGLAIRLQIGARHSRRLSVNASPILGTDSRRHGVLVTFDDQTIIESDNLQLTNFLGRFGEEMSQLREQLQSHMDQKELKALTDIAHRATDLAHLFRCGSTLDDGSSAANTDLGISNGTLALESNHSS